MAPRVELTDLAVAELDRSIIYMIRREAERAGMIAGLTWQTRKYSWTEEAFLEVKKLWQEKEFASFEEAMDAAGKFGTLSRAEPSELGNAGRRDGVLRGVA
ncbi:MAG: hypothetical protein U1E56_14435 [Bauldia sp.]